MREDYLMERGYLIGVGIALAVGTFGCGGKVDVPKSEGPRAHRSLPAEIEGVERDGEILRVKPGFKWVKQGDGTMTVARPANPDPNGDVIRVGCACETGQNDCEAVLVNDDTIRCQTKGNCLACKFYKPDDLIEIK